VADPPSLPRVVRYSRRTCGLCDKARSVIQGEQAKTAFRFEEVFIDGDDALERSHGLPVPVVEVDRQEEFEYAIEPSRLHRVLSG
jgi:glutaredoxin